MSVTAAPSFRQVWTHPGAPSPPVPGTPPSRLHQPRRCSGRRLGHPHRGRRPIRSRHSLAFGPVDASKRVGGHPAAQHFRCHPARRGWLGLDHGRGCCGCGRPHASRNRPCPRLGGCFLGWRDQASAELARVHRRRCPTDVGPLGGNDLPGRRLPEPARRRGVQLDLHGHDIDVATRLPAHTGPNRQRAVFSPVVQAKQRPKSLTHRAR